VRGEARDVEAAIQVAGKFSLIGNHVSGFDQAEATALLLKPDRAGRTYKPVFRSNVLQDCAGVVKEAEKGLWESAAEDGNVFLDCGDAQSDQLR
jgi:hypothetical protein